MIRSLHTEGGGFHKNLPIAPYAPDAINWFTVFIAENGGRKSFLLRCIAEAALGNRRYSPSKSVHITLAPPPQLPQRVIAISGTPLDRFPRVGTRDLRSQTRSVAKKHTNFVYLGPRASNGMAGVAQSERSLIGSLISNRQLLNERKDLLAHVFAHINLEARVDVHLQISPAKEGGEADLEDIEREAESSSSLEKLALREAIRDFRSGAKGSDKYAEKLDRLRQRGQCALSISAEETIARGDLTAAMWELLLRLGRVTISGTTFYRQTRTTQELPGDQLSSGQWGWLGAFGALVAELRDGALILIDEPENSLHPRWQQSFMPELHHSLQSCKDCQVIVATHSPLIASGVSPKWGNVRTLHRANRSNAVVHSRELMNAFGWSASDVYDELFDLGSTRAPEFIKLTNQILGHISARENISCANAKDWIKSLGIYMQSLPVYDPMRAILTDIIDKLKPFAAQSRAR